MSLYDDILLPSEPTSLEKAVAKDEDSVNPPPPASAFGAMQMSFLKTQLDARKAGVHSKAKSADVKIGPQVPSTSFTPINLQPKSVPQPLKGGIDITKRVAPLKIGATGTFSILPQGVTEDKVLLFNEIHVEDEYIPTAPTDYITYKPRREVQVARERAAREVAERIQREHADEARKRASGAAIAPPVALMEQDSTVFAEPEPPKPTQPKIPKKDVAASIMSRMGYQQGMGLGKDGKGISIALQVKRTGKSSAEKSNADDGREVSDATMLQVIHHLKCHEESTQSSGSLDRSDTESRFPFGFVLKIDNTTAGTHTEYMLTRRLGRGGYSEVRLGKLRSDRKQRFAVKVIDLHRAKTKRMGKQQMVEIEVLKSLEHADRVIRMYDSKIVERDCIFIVMELATAEMTSFNKEVKLSPKVARGRWRDMVRCVQQVHALDIIHCDIKPSNFVRVGRIIKIIDFGCATFLGPLNEAVIRTKVLGTTRFMAPEYLGQRIASKSLDIWALGFILYWLASGKRLFTQPHNSLRRVILAPKPLVDYKPVEDADCRQLLTTILIKDWHLRPSCEEILHSEYILKHIQQKAFTGPFWNRKATNRGSYESTESRDKFDDKLEK